jgi:hypothetical protein
MPRHYVLLALALVVTLVAPAAFAQELPETNNAVFAPLDLPTPNAYRAANGEPGPAYWQNRADYEIEAALDSTDHRVTGTVTLRYTNHSPQALDHLWVHLEQNFFALDSRATAMAPPGSRWRGAFDEGGFRLGEVTIAQGGLRYAPPVLVDDTRMRVDLREPLEASGGTLTLIVPYAFVVPEYGADRHGLFEAARGTVYEFAQWYPRIAVFDDVNGWNALPYLGQGEFYLEYGNYDVALTVPSNMTVVATGMLQNPEEVWTAEQRAQLARAMTTNAVVPVIAPDEVDGPRPTRAGTTTWRFRAENVRDFAWAASPAFILDATSVDDGAGGRTLVMAAYPHEGLGTAEAPGWEHGAAFSQHAIGYYAERWFPYPYPAAVSVGGIVGGMEYPGIQFSDVSSRGFDLFAVIDHELGHNWFPMIVGNDERRFAWMDEGFNTFINTYSSLTYFNERAEQAVFGAGEGLQAPYVAATRAPVLAAFAQSPLADQAIYTYPDQTRPFALGWLAYFKPAHGLLLLREHVLGPERFDAAFRAYVRRWAYKHPQPADFFRTIEDVSGEDLDWFWRGWIMGTGTYDVAVTGVAEAEDGAGTVITFENRGEVVLPLEAEVTYEGGRTERVRLPVEVFFRSDVVATGVTGGRVVGVRLDPDGKLPDVDPANGVWPAIETDEGEAGGE